MIDGGLDIQALRDRITELEELLGVLRRPHGIKGFTPTEWKFIGFLAKKGSFNREDAIRSVYGGLPEADQPSDSRIVDQFMHRIRKKIVPYGIVISTENYMGYYVDSQNQEKLRLLFDA